MSGSEDRTEAPSARRLQRARDEGNVAVSRELGAVAVLGATALLLAAAGGPLSETLVLRLRAVLEQMHRLDAVTGLRMAGVALVLAAAPFALAPLVAGASATLLQTGFLFNLSALMPKFSRLHPRNGLQRLASKRTLVEAGKSVVKLGVVAAAGWQATRHMLPLLPASTGWDAGLLSAVTGAQVGRILMAMLAAQLAVAALDVLYSRWQHTQTLRMSRHDLREEQRESDGDPKVKQRLRQIRMQRSRRRMMAEVPRATVVVTNPTHYAVALAYDRSKAAAPIVVAKGVDEMAARIRELARESGVPIVANPPLARALHLVKLDGEIPAEHFQAVAELIAYVWRLRGRAQPQAAAAGVGR